MGLFGRKPKAAVDSQQEGTLIQLENLGGNHFRAYVGGVPIRDAFGETDVHVPDGKFFNLRFDDRIGGARDLSELEDIVRRMEDGAEKMRLLVDKIRESNPENG